MLIATGTTLALYCPYCGRLAVYEVSRFALANGRRLDIRCDCGKVITKVYLRGRKNVDLHIPCILCETNHLISFTGSQFWSPVVNKIYCPNTNLELGFYGDQYEVRRVLDRCRAVVDEISEDADCDDYFDNPVVMVDMLNWLHDLAEQDNLYCSCGCDDIDVEICSDHIELSCNQCQSLLMFPAKADEDGRAFRQLHEIELAGWRHWPKRKP